MTTNTKNTRTLGRVADENAIDGLKKHAQTLPSMFINGVQMPVADVIATLQKRVDSADHVVLARAAWQQAVQADSDLRTQTRPLVTAVIQGLQLAFAGDAATLADYGLKPRKPRVLTPQQKVEASAKAKATRTARHTMGSKQKAQIKGMVEVPATAPAAPAPAANAPSSASPPASSPVAAPSAPPVAVVAPKAMG